MQVSFHAWIEPQNVKTGYVEDAGLFSPTMNIGKPLKRQLLLEHGAQAEITVFTSVKEEGGNFPVKQHTVLSIIPPQPFEYETAMDIASAVEIMFSFLIGARLDTAVLHLPTTRTYRWNEKDYPVTAECWIVPAGKRTHPPHPKRRMLKESNSPISTEHLLNICLSNQEHLISMMNLVLALESNYGNIVDRFEEVLGCLEEFDKRQFGSGRDPKISRVRRQLKKLVEKYGNDEERTVCAQIGTAYRNEFSLRQRLQRLFDKWTADGFKGQPNLKRMVDIRNLKPHGRGQGLSPDVVREIVDFLPFLSALARYHILRTLGFDPAAIAAGFSRLSRRYHAFLPGPDQQA